MANKYTWPRGPILCEDGMREGISPRVITASRATDIPAFHTAWFFQRLQAGYCVWTNPFNGQPTVVNLRDVRAVVFWSKNPAPLLPRLAELDARGLAYYFQFTLNDYDAQGYEPGVPPLDARVETFRELSRRLGPHRVVWRFDPILLTDELSAQRMAQRVEAVAQRLSGFTQKLVFSFVIIEKYKKVATKLRHLPHHVRAPEPAEMHFLAGRLGEIGTRYGMEVAACCEEMDLSAHGIQPSRCVDGELLLRLAENDPVLTAFLTQAGDQTPLPGLATVDYRRLKDPGQRKNCGCILAKDIGRYDTCPHHCVYCYANTSVTAVERNCHSLSIHGESIPGE